MADHDSLTSETEPQQDAPLERSEFIESRFLFVDVAALRAKQLRRGARLRFDSEQQPHKLERLAMEEVRRGLVHYDVPPPSTIRIAQEPA